MPLNENARKRIETSKIAPGVILRTLEAICAAGEAIGGVSGEFKVDYQDADMPVKTGDMIPFIIMGIRPATITDEEIK